MSFWLFLLTIVLSVPLRLTTSHHPFWFLNFSDQNSSSLDNKHTSHWSSYVSSSVWHVCHVMWKNLDQHNQPHNTCCCLHLLNVQCSVITKLHFTRLRSNQMYFHCLIPIFNWHHPIHNIRKTKYVIRTDKEFKDTTGVIRIVSRRADYTMGK